MCGSESDDQLKSADPVQKRAAKAYGIRAGRRAAKLQADAVMRGLDTTPPTAPPEFPPSDFKRIELGRVLKDKGEDSVRVIKLDGKDFVLKPADGDSANNCAAAKFIGRMNMPGVRAPRAEMLDNGFRDGVTNLKGVDPNLKQILSKDAQLSEFAQGKDIDNIFAGRKRKDAPLTTEQEAFKAFALSDKGVAAFAGVAAMDLVTGMKDRIVGWWNTANFAFDDTDPNDKVLSCHDNAKFDYGLLDTRPDKYVGFLEVAMTDSNRASYPSLVEMIYDSVYGARFVFNFDNPGQYVGPIPPDTQSKMKTIIRNVLLDVCNNVAQNEKSTSEPARRAKVLKTMLDVEQYCRPPEWAINVAPPPADARESMVGAIKGGLRSAATGAAAMGSKLGIAGQKTTNWDKQTERLKDALRSFKVNRADAIRQLDNLTEDYENGKSDRRYTNIMFLANAVGFIEFLREGVDALEKDSLSGKLSLIPDGFRNKVLTEVEQVQGKMYNYAEGDEDIQKGLKSEFARFKEAYTAQG